MKIRAGYLAWGRSTGDIVALLAGHVGIGVFVLSAFALKSANADYDWCWYAVGSSLLLYVSGLSIGFGMERRTHQTHTR